MQIVKIRDKCEYKYSKNFHHHFIFPVYVEQMHGHTPIYSKRIDALTYIPTFTQIFKHKHKYTITIRRIENWNKKGPYLDFEKLQNFICISESYE